MKETINYQYRFKPRLKNLSLYLISAGMLLVILQLIFPWHGQADHSTGEVSFINQRLFSSIHLALLCSIPMALGGLFFCAINHLAGSRWCITIRRIAEHSLWFLPIPFLLMLIVFYGIGDVFHHWVQAPATDHLIEIKSPYLNKTFFIVRNLIFFLLWGLFGYILWFHSVRQDRTGAFTHTQKMSRYSAIFLIIFCLTYSVNSWDFSMSLEPHWYSTMWAVYLFAGLALTTYALLILWACHFRRQGMLLKEFNENHLHDLGKFALGHTIFWGYIAISQYMLIWFAAIPEETIFFKTRSENGWLYISMGLAFIRFVIPFFLLLKQNVKRDFAYMKKIAILILVGQVWDMYWILYPTIDNGYFIFFSWQEIGPLALIAGSYIYIMATMLRKYEMIPIKDVRLQKCLDFHQ